MPDYSLEVRGLERIITAAKGMMDRYERGFPSIPQDDIALLNSVGRMFSGYGLDRETDSVVRDICIDHELDDTTYEAIIPDTLTDGWVDRVEGYELPRRSAA